MDKELLMDAYKAAKRMNCGVRNVWMLFRRLSLKYVLRDGKKYTCEKWIEEYYEHRHSKDYHSIHNGRKVFDPEKGELSISMVMKELNVCRTAVMYYILTGRLKTTRKGNYYVIAREELDRFINEECETEEVEKNA